MIEASYERLLTLLDAHLSEHALRDGRAARRERLRRSTVSSPSSRASIRRRARSRCAIAPRVVAWVDVVEDLSGLEPQRRRLARRATRLPATLRALLGEVGRVYAPFLLANAAALARGAERVECAIDGQPWVQKPFPYQAKCLTWLREARAALAASDRGALDAMLAGTGCEALY